MYSDGDYVWVPSEVISSPRLSAAAVRIYSILLMNSTEFGWCFATHEHIAGQIGDGPRKAAKAIQELRRAGFVSVPGNGICIKIKPHLPVPGY